jgi:hypothetical protein
MGQGDTMREWSHLLLHSLGRAYNILWPAERLVISRSSFTTSSNRGNFLLTSCLFAYFLSLPVLQVRSCMCSVGL